MKNFFLVLLGMIILSSCSEYLDSSDQTYQDPPESSLAITIDEARSDLESLLTQPVTDYPVEEELKMSTPYLSKKIQQDQLTQRRTTLYIFSILKIIMAMP